MKRSSVEMVCPACDGEALLRREPLYDGFRKSGERLSCPLCGYLFASEAEVPFKPREEAPQVFTAEDRTPPLKIFDGDGELRFCCRCAEYIVNPFMQYCGRHKKEVQATEFCAQFLPGGERRAIERFVPIRNSLRPQRLCEG